LYDNYRKIKLFITQFGEFIIQKSYSSILKEFYEMETDNLKWRLVEAEHLVDDEWIDFRKCSYRLPDNTISGPYYNYSRKNYVVVVATDESGNYICVKQYRHGIGEVTTEFPAGGIESVATDSANNIGNRNASLEEDALEAARRELQEETGYVSDEWEHLITVPSNATMADNYAHIYRARNCRLVSSQNLDDNEFVTVTTVSDDELESMIHMGHFQQAMHIMAYYYR